MNKQIIALFLLFVIFLVTAIPGTIFYYHGKISNLNRQISKLQKQIENLTTANLTSALTITEIPWPNHFLNGTMIPDYYIHGFNDLFINGSASNMGGGTAFNAGLHVVAYGEGILKINMTVPLDNGNFGTDATTNTYVLNYYKDYLGSLQLGYLKSGQTATFDISLFHEGPLSGNWTVTPVWINTP